MYQRLGAVLLVMGAYLDMRAIDLRLPDPHSCDEAKIFFDAEIVPLYSCIYVEVHMRAGLAVIRTSLSLEALQIMEQKILRRRMTTHCSGGSKLTRAGRIVNRDFFHRRSQSNQSI